MTGGAIKRGPAERRYQRATCDFDAEISWGTITHSARVRIISMGGCFLETAVLVPVGSDLEVTISLEDGPPILCQGKVAWFARGRVPLRGRERLPGFALEFIRIYPEDRARLEEYVRRRTRLFHAIVHELEKAKPDRALIKELFSNCCPRESTHLNHIRKVCREELKYFRLRP